MFTKINVCLMLTTSLIFTSCMSLKSDSISETKSGCSDALDDAFQLLLSKWKVNQEIKKSLREAFDRSEFKQLKSTQTGDWKDVHFVRLAGDEIKFMVTRSPHLDMMINDVKINPSLKSYFIGPNFRLESKNLKQIDKAEDLQSKIYENEPLYSILRREAEAAMTTGTFKEDTIYLIGPGNDSLIDGIRAWDMNTVDPDSPMPSLAKYGVLDPSRKEFKIMDNYDVIHRFYPEEDLMKIFDEDVADNDISSMLRGYFSLKGEDLITMEEFTSDSRMLVYLVEDANGVEYIRAMKVPQDPEHVVDATDFFKTMIRQLDNSGVTGFDTKRFLKERYSYSGNVRPAFKVKKTMVWQDNPNYLKKYDSYADALALEFSVSPYSRPGGRLGEKGLSLDELVQLYRSTPSARSKLSQPEVAGGGVTSISDAFRDQLRAQHERQLNRSFRRKVIISMVVSPFVGLGIIVGTPLAVLASWPDDCLSVDLETARSMVPNTCSGLELDGTLISAQCLTKSGYYRSRTHMSLCNFSTACDNPIVNSNGLLSDGC